MAYLVSWARRIQCVLGAWEEVAGRLVRQSTYPIDYAVKYNWLTHIHRLGSAGWLAGWVGWLGRLGRLAGLRLEISDPL